MSKPAFATGRCVCGSVTYTLHAEPARMAQCHCKGCQQSSGTGHMSLAFFREADIEIQGETREYGATADSGNINYRIFCPTCGSRLFNRNSARPGVMGVTAGTLDDNSWFKPQAIVYHKDKPVWDLMASDIPMFDTMPPPPPTK